MSSTAERWFVPDQEYYHTINDYALVRQSAALVREDILYTDSAPCHDIDPDDTLMTEYARLNYETCYRFAAAGRLLYADVDDEEPAHEEKVKQWAKELPLEEESEKSTETKKELIKALVNVWFPEQYYPRGDNDKDLSEKERERWTLKHLNLLIGQGRLEVHVNSCILTANSVEEKEELLNLMSGQIMRRTKRPVLALISMVDSKQTTEVGETEGWVTGYDFIKDLLMIKPFSTKGGKHPLGGKWYSDVAQDGVSFSGTPQEFAKAYTELGNTIEASGNNEINGFKLLVHTLAAKWMIRFGKNLITAYGAEFRTDLLAVSDAQKKIKKTMAEIKFPIVRKNTNKKEELGLENGPLVWLQAMIETEESEIRDAAVDAKERGEEKVARNAAKLFESIHEQIKAFNENPAMDL